MTFDIDKYIEKEKKTKFSFPKFKLPKIKLPKFNKPDIKLNQNTTILLVVVIAAIAYVYVEKSKIAYQEEIRQEKILNEKMQQRELESCLSNAEDSYNLNWNSQCKSIGKKEDCSLPSYRADQVEKWRTDARKECMEKFKNGGFSSSLLNNYKD